MRWLVLSTLLLLGCPAEDGPTDPVDTGDVDSDTEPGEGDPSLASLTVEGVSLFPPFRPEVLAYRATFPGSTDAATILAEPVQDDAEIAIDGEAAPDGEATVDLDYGDNVIPVQVTDRDGGTATYTLTLTRDGEGSLDVDLTADRTSWAAGEAVDVRVTVDVDARDGATVDTVTLDADGLVDDPVLVDDGTGPDSTAGDGTWTALLRVPDTAAGGSYRLLARATGTDTAGDELSETDALSVEVQQEYVVSTSIVRWDSIASTGTAVELDLSTPVELPFDSGFFGDPLPAGTRLYVDEYGKVHIGAPGQGILPGPLSRYLEAGADPMIAVYHHAQSRMDRVYTQVEGSEPNRRFIIEWRGAYIGPEGRINHRLILHENSSTIIIGYGEQTDDLFRPTEWAQFLLADEDRSVLTATPSAPRPSTLRWTQWTYTW